MSRQEAEKTLRALGVTLDEGHGSVKELRAEINAIQRTPLRFSPERQCLGKRRFTTQQGATVIANRMSKEQQYVHPYHCGYCRGWHNGHAR